MPLDVDYKRGKLLDYWVDKCTRGEVSEEEMERQHDRLADMSPRQIDQQYEKKLRRRQA